MKNEIEAQDFIVTLEVGESDEWNSTDEIKHSFGVGPSGDLMIFRSVYNAQFGAALKKDERWFIYAPGTWLRVEVLDRVEEVDAQDDAFELVNCS